MKTFLGTAALAVVTMLAALAAVGDGALAEGNTPMCSVSSLAGRWLFATDVGQFPALGGDITALGTMTVHRDGRVEGRFDATVALVGFLPGNTYDGSIVVNPDCTGTLTFVTSESTQRTDSIAIVSRRDLWGMSQDPENLWTYRARRLSSSPHQ